MWERVRGDFCRNLLTSDLCISTMAFPAWCLPSCLPLSWGQGGWPHCQVEPGRAVNVCLSLSREGPPCSLRTGTALRLTSLIGCHVTSGEGVVSWFTGWTWLSLRGVRLAAMASQEAAGAAHEACVWGSVEVRGHRSGAPHCAFPWGGLGIAWGSGMPLWGDCSYSLVLREG